MVIDKEDLFNNKIYFLNFINKLDNNDFQKLITLFKLIKKQYSGLSISIKSPNPSNDRTWGDFFFASSLKKSLEKKGFDVTIHERDNWEKDDVDIVIVLRGREEYIPKTQHLNFMWNISHPDDISFEEYSEYDIVFVASNKYADFLNSKIQPPVYPLLQCTDLENFFPQKNTDFYEEDILFVGVTRGVFRKIIQDILKTTHSFSIYGKGWEEFINPKYIKGNFIENYELNKVYSNSKILLNDHWADMAEQDFVSNRIFDALACKTFVISDEVESIQNLFEGNVVTYSDFTDLDDKLNYYLTHEEERIHLANNGYQIVSKYHTFDIRVDEMLQIIEKKFIPEFINKFEMFVNEKHFELNQKEFPLSLINEYFEEDYDKILGENKSLAIKNARLKDRIHLLEQEKETIKKFKHSKKNNRLLNFLRGN